MDVLIFMAVFDKGSEDPSRGSVRGSRALLFSKKDCVRCPVPYVRDATALGIFLRLELLQLNGPFRLFRLFGTFRFHAESEVFLI